MKFTEALVASLGIMLMGWVSIPLVGHMSGVDITINQGVVMSAWFFVFRLVWLYALRLIFARADRHAARSTPSTTR